MNSTETYAGGVLDEIWTQILPSANQKSYHSPVWSVEKARVFDFYWKILTSIKN
jgi:hypothetical protein